MPSTVSFEAIIQPGVGGGYLFAAINGSTRHYFVVQREGDLMNISGDNFANQNVMVDDYTVDDWYYVAVTLSFNSGSNQTTVNAWSANLTTSSSLTHVVVDEVENGTFIQNNFYGLGMLRNNSIGYQEAYPGAIDEIAIYNGLKDQDFFQGNHQLILAAVPEPSLALLGVMGASVVFYRRRR